MKYLTLSLTVHVLCYSQISYLKKEVFLNTKLMVSVKWGDNEKLNLLVRWKYLIFCSKLERNFDERCCMKCSSLNWYQRVIFLMKWTLHFIQTTPFINDALPEIEFDHAKCNYEEWNMEGSERVKLQILFFECKLVWCLEKLSSI